MFGLKQNKTEVSKSKDLTLSFACLNLFCLPVFVLLKHKLFHQLESVYFFILPFFFEVHCVKRVELLLRKRESIVHSRSLSTKHTLVQVHGLM